MTLKIAKLLRLKENGVTKIYVEIIYCRVATCGRAILPKINEQTGNFIYPERCPECRSPYYNEPYSRSDML